MSNIATQFKKGHPFIKGGEKGWFKKGHHLNKGKIMSQETKNKLSLSHKGKRASPKTEFKKGRIYTMSQETKDKIRQMTPRRENHPNWKGGITRLDKLERNKFREIMQKQVFKRDNYTCQLCGQKGGNLQVDHIQSWAEYVEQRFNITNCRTLCMDCHYLITFGRPKPEGIIWGQNVGKNGWKTRYSQLKEIINS